MPSRLRKSPSQQRGGGYEVLTYLRQSWIQTSLCPRVPRHWPRSRKVTSSRPLEIDVDRASERIGKISRACLFRSSRRPTDGRPFVGARFSAFSHTAVKMRAQTWPGTYPASDFSSAPWGLRASARSGGRKGGDFADWRKVEANLSREFGDSGTAKCSCPDYLFLSQTIP